MSESSPSMGPSEIEEGPWPDFPWLTILIAPRKTIRKIVDSDSRRYVYLLVFLYGIVAGLLRSMDQSGGETLSLVEILIIVPIAGTIGAFIGWGIGGKLFRWTGSWFGGEATVTEVRAAMAWSAVPYIMSLALWLPMVLYCGHDLFLLDGLRVAQNPFPLLLVDLLFMALYLWWGFLFWKCFAELNRLSLWRSLAAIGIPYLVVVAILAVIGLIAMVLL